MKKITYILILLFFSKIKYSYFIYNPTSLVDWLIPRLKKIEIDGNNLKFGQGQIICLATSNLVYSKDMIPMVWGYEGRFPFETN